MNIRVLVLALLAIASWSPWATAYGALVARLGGAAVFDGDRNITWLANANLADSTAFGVAGIQAAGNMTWDTAQAWIAAMNAQDGGLGYLGFNDWRLPTSLNPDGSGPCGPALSCDGSEFGHLFYSELGGTAGASISSSSDPDLGLFQNIAISGYWTATQAGADQAWHFDFDDGNQLPGAKTLKGYVWAVRTGDVAAVPLPAAAWLFGSGLVGLAAFMRGGVDRRPR